MNILCIISIISHSSHSFEAVNGNENMRVVELILRSGQFLSCLNSTRLMQPEFSFSCPQGPAACHCLEADKLIPRRHMLFKVYFNIILSYIYSFISIQPLGRF